MPVPCCGSYFPAAATGSRLLQQPCDLTNETAVNKASLISSRQAFCQGKSALAGSTLLSNKRYEERDDSRLSSSSPGTVRELRTFPFLHGIHSPELHPPSSRTSGAGHLHLDWKPEEHSCGAGPPGEHRPLPSCCLLPELRLPPPLNIIINK